MKSRTSVLLFTLFGLAGSDVGLGLHPYLNSSGMLLLHGRQPNDYRLHKQSPLEVTRGGHF